MSNETIVTVTLGERTFSPVQFHSFHVGPFTASGPVRPGETIEQASERMLGSLENVMMLAFERALARFREQFRAAKGR